MREHEELAALLIADAECLEVNQPDLMSLTNHQLRRAAALLRQPAPAPAAVPVARPADEWHEDMGDVLFSGSIPAAIAGFAFFVSAICQEKK